MMALYSKPKRFGLLWKMRIALRFFHGGRSSDKFGALQGDSTWLFGMDLFCAGWCVAKPPKVAKVMTWAIKMMTQMSHYGFFRVLHPLSILCEGILLPFAWTRPAHTLLRLEKAKFT
jgi:hypothetical protein